jgi:hypothetical protein
LSPNDDHDEIMAALCAAMTAAEPGLSLDCRSQGAIAECDSEHWYVSCEAH